MGQEERELAFQRTRKVLTGSSCEGKRLEVHASHILFVWRLQWPALSIQPPICSLFLYSFYLFFVSSTLFPAAVQLAPLGRATFSPGLICSGIISGGRGSGESLPSLVVSTMFERGSRLLLMGRRDRAQAVPVRGCARCH